MIYNIVAVKDELTETFLQPQFGENKDALLRIFSHQINTIPLWKENASDFSLYSLGTFDESTGMFTSSITKIISGHAVLKKGEKDDLQSDQQAAEN